MGELQLNVLLFGGLRKYSRTGQIALTVPSGSTVSQVKNSLVEKIKAQTGYFSDEALLNVSVVGAKDRLLSGKTIIESDCEIAILPPVSGG